MLTSAISKKNNSGKPRKQACETEKEFENDRLMEELLEKDPMAYWIKIQDDDMKKTMYIPEKNQCKFVDCKEYGFYYNNGANFCLACARQQNSAWLVSESEWIAKDPTKYECLDDGC